MEMQFPAPVAETPAPTPAPTHAPVPAQHSAPVMSAPLESEKVVVSAPLSFHGSASRIWKLTRLGYSGFTQVALVVLALCAVAMAWAFVAAWYMTWGLLLVPYRLIRRGSRKRKVNALQHRETLAALQQRS